MLNIHFAPLQGYTEAPYRCIHNAVAGGVSTYYTPFIRIEHGKVRPKDLREARPESNIGVHVIPQIIVADRDEFLALSSRILDLGHHELDVNMGCPFPLQTRIGRGSGLLPNIEKVEAITTEIKRLTDAGVKVSVKMRLGQDSFDQGYQVIPLLNDCGLSHLTLHPRLGKDQYKGELSLDQFDRFYQELRMPVVFNGGISTISDLQKLESQYPSLAGVMIGRGLLSCPTLAAEYQQGRELSETERRQVVMNMYRKLRAHYNQSIEGGEGQLLLKMKSFFDYLEPLFGHKPIKKVLKAGSFRNFDEAVANLPK